MEKFAEKFNENISLIKTALGDVCSVTHVKAVFKDWVSPEDHQQVAKALGNTTDKLDCAEERVGLLEKTVDQLKSQLEKKKPEIPEFVATEIEEKNRRFSNFHKTANIESYVKEVHDWYYEKPYHAELFYRAILDGYTVAEEKRFYLKNKLTRLNLVVEQTFSLTGKHVGERFREFEMQYIPTDEQEARLYKNTFTQQEIDSMETGSYEQVEVTE